MRVDRRVDGEAGPFVVLANSLGTTTELWDRQVEPLSRVARIVRYDHRGHGGTPVPDEPFAVADLGRDVLELADDLGAERFSFVGISLGGAVGLWLGAHAPERLDRLVLACALPRFGDPDGWLDRARTVREQGLEPIADTVVRRWFTSAVAPQTFARFRAMLCATSPPGYAACCEALARWDFRDQVAAVRVPTLAIAGESDSTAPPASIEALAAAIAGAHFATIAHAAHLPNVEQPDAVTAAIADHLELEGR